MRSNTSRDARYQWNNSYIGRGLNKVERAFTLRHHCFNFVILHNLFMIHSTSMHLIDVTVSDEEKAKWNKYNLKLFEEQREHFFLDKDSCTHPKRVDNSTWYQWIAEQLANLQPVLAHPLHRLGTIH